jgi:glycosyltransferase involved in cell wall biosynthesis
MRKKLAFDEGKTAVVQFGSLNKWFGSGDREIARDDVEAELGLAEDARIVLACGTMNFRKGIDLFAEVACTVLERSGENTDLHFVWVGGGETHYDSAYYWAEKMVRDRGFDANVHFVGERFQTEKYFLSADLFILTSRADPFPCVVQEAMSCSLPVIAFEGSSGAAEAVGDSGVIVPFGAGAMAKAVEDLLADDLGRKKRSRRAREILETKNTTFSYTNEIFEHVRNSAPTIADRILARPDPRAHAGREDLVVLVATSTSDSSEASLHAQQVVKQLIANGLDAEMLFVRGPSVLSRAEKMVPLPEVPFSFLYPKSQSPEHVREEIVRHLTTDRGPCVFVPSFDDAVLDVIPALPPHVATMAIVHGETPQQLERVYSLSRHFDRIVCTSPDAREELVEANPRLKNCLSTIPPRVAVDANKVEAAAGAPESRSPASEIRLLCAGMDNGELSRTVSVVKLAKLLRDAQVSFRLSVLVDAAEARAIRAVAPDLLSNGNLSLLEAASLAEIRAALAGNDLFFFGGAGGSSSFLVAEAMAAGCIPILRVSGQPASSASALKDGKNSHFLDNGSLRNLVQILRDHQQAPDRLARMSKAARRTCLEQMADEKLMGAEYADACRSALQTRAKRGKETQFGRQRAGGLLRTG